MLLLNNSFIITKEDFNDFFRREDSLVKEDIRNGVYKTEEVFYFVKRYKFQKILKKARSLSYRTVLFQYSNMESLSLLQAISRNRVEREKIYSDAIEKYGTIIVNDNGGYSPATISDVENAEEYDFGMESIFKKNPDNLIIENDNAISNDLDSAIPTDLVPSRIMNYKYVMQNACVNEFILSNESWTLWIETQGMDIDLYHKFLSVYHNNIREIKVLTSSVNLVKELSKEYPDIIFDII